MSEHHEEEALGKAYDARLLGRLARYMRPYKWQVASALALTLAVTPLEAVIPYLFHVGIDSLIVPAVRHTISENAAMVGLTWVALAFLASLVLGFALQYAQVLIMQRVGQETMYDLRKEIFEHLQRLPLSFFDRSPVGRLVTRVTTDVDALNDLFAAGVVAMLNDFFLVILFIAILLKVDWRLALVTLSVMPLLLLATLLFRDKVREANRRIRVAIARINAFLQEHIAGMSVVQLFNRERKASEQFAEHNRAHMVAYKDAILAFALFYPAVEFLSVMAVALLFWYGGLKVLAGTVQVGVLVMFMQYAQRFFRPIQDLSEKFNILQSAIAASERIFQLLDEPATLALASDAVAPADARGEIEFDRVWFAYRGGASPKEDDWVLRDVSLRVAPGQTVAVVGHTGAGKTTLIQLLLRFYELQRGHIYLDGTDIRAMNFTELRRRFGIVLQDPFLFTGTIESNVRLGSAWIDRDAVERALHQVGLGDFVRSLPRGVETLVNERGSTLSMGQRQLISFARALAHDPKVLILDEATSSVDTKTELLIRQALDRLLTGRTAVVIAHRLSTIQHADRILVFHKSRLREQGTHQELLALRGIYYRLYQLQYKDQEIRLPTPLPATPARPPLPADD